MLSVVKITSFKPRDKLYRVADNGGLCLEVTPTGSKLWRWKYTYSGKPQMLALGKYPAVTLAQARMARDEARALLVAGKHPTREKHAKRLRSQIDNDNTFATIARRWLENKSARLHPKYAKQTLDRMEQHVFPLIGDLPITQIKIPDVVKVVEKIAKGGTPETARRMKQVIGQSFRYACQIGVCETNPAGDMRDILPPKQERHHASIKPTEMSKLMEAVNGYTGDQLTKAAMQLLALTFVRTRELIEAEWSEIDWENKEWHIPATRMKMRRPHVVPLSKQTIAILKGLQKLTGDKPYIFYSSRSKSRHLSNGVFLMALRRMGYEGKMTGHGFRSLASTILNERGYAPDVIERQLAHADEDKIRAAYNRAEYLFERKKMMQDYANLLNAIASPEIITHKLDATRV